MGCGAHKSKAWHFRQSLSFSSLFSKRVNIKSCPLVFIPPSFFVAFQGPGALRIIVTSILTTVIPTHTCALCPICSIYDTPRTTHQKTEISALLSFNVAGRHHNH